MCTEKVMDEDGNIISNTTYSTHDFVFDHVYDESSSQKKVYETTARTVVDSALQGYNATIFAYGQTGTGKTFTMEGFNREGSVEARGIIPRAIEQIFGHIQRNASPRMRYLVRASYLQIYNEQISDLLKPERSNLTIREDKRRGVFVEGLSEWVVRSPAEIYGLMERGGHVRATGETKMNEVSSRSHAVFIVIAEQSETVYVDDKGSEVTLTLTPTRTPTLTPTPTPNPADCGTVPEIHAHPRRPARTGHQPPRRPRTPII